MSISIIRLILLLFCALFSLQYFLEVRQLRLLEDSFVVQVLFWLLMFLLLVKALTHLIYALREKDGKEFTIFASGKSFLDLLNNNSAKFMGLTGLYMLIIPRLGIFVTSFLYIVFSYWALNVRGWTKRILLPVLVISIVYIGFVLLIGARLPKGLFI